MLTQFVRKDRLAFYESCPYKARLDLLGQRLITLEYRAAVIEQHVREWIRIVEYFQKHKLPLPHDLSDASTQAYLTYRKRMMRSASRFRTFRASVRMFVEADEHGVFPKHMIRTKYQPPSWLSVDRYLSFMSDHRGLSSKTARGRLRQITQFGQFLERKKVRSFEAIKPVHIQQFALTIQRLSIAARLTYAVSLRSFLRWAFGAGLLPRNLHPAISVPRRFKHMGIRDMLSEREVERVLAAVDRSTVLGRRDYALLTLAARYGLRPGDIRELQLDAIHWRKGIFDIVQAKTGRQLTLPLLPDVAEALSAYIRDGRPATPYRHIFIRHLAPFDPFVETNNLAFIMRRALKRVGLHHRTGRHCLYLFRHTLASRLLEKNCSMKHIGDVLGHASTNSTREYTSIDLTGLRRVMISEREVCA